MKASTRMYNPPPVIVTAVANKISEVSRFFDKYLFTIATPANGTQPTRRTQMQVATTTVCPVPRCLT